MKSIREVRDVNDDVSTTKSYGSDQGRTNYSNFSSPRNVAPPADINKSQKSDEKPKMPFTKKMTSPVEEANSMPTVSGVKRRNGMGSLKDMAVKFHSDIVRGINIARSMGLNN